ncbi:hypothetical protein H8959_006336 [Pygathrix nigripes]
MLYVFMGQDFRERLIHSLPASLERALTEDSAQTSDAATNSALPSAEVELQANSSLDSHDGFFCTPPMKLSKPYSSASNAFI